MGSGSSVNKEFMNPIYRQRLEVTLGEEIERFGIEQVKAKEIIQRVSAKTSEIVQENITTVQIKVDKRATTFVCAVDGSDAADIGYQSIKVLMKKIDHLCLFHAYSEQKDTVIPVHLRSKSILNKYDTDLLSNFSKERYSLLWENRQNETVKDVVAKLISLYEKLSGGNKPDFLVLGYTGNKGITKKDGATTIGSVSDFAMRSIYIPIIIIKDLVKIGPKSYIMAVDDSEISLKGLNILYSLIRPQDTLTIINITDVKMDTLGNDQTTSIETIYKKELSDSAPTTNTIFRSIIRRENKTVFDEIFDYVEENLPDFFALSPRTSPENKLTALTENIILKLKCNIILAKS